MTLCLQQELCSDSSDKHTSLHTHGGGGENSDKVVLEQVKGTASICLGSKMEKPGECCTKSPENSEAKLEADSVESSLKIVSELTLEHVEPESLNCNTCFKSFSKQIYLKRHEIIHTKRTVSTCNSRGSGLTLSGDLPQHKRTRCRLRGFEKDHSAEELLNKCSKFVCSVCSKAFTKQVYLKRHEVVHSGERPYVCRQCGGSFSRTGDLAKHLRTHSRDGTPRTTSPTFLNASALNTGDVGSHVFLCKVCSRTFTKEYYLRQHEVVHNEASMYLCDQCGKSFFRRGALTQHKATHSSVKSHFCNICNKAFAFVGRLKEHKRLHLGIKPYLCNMCGKAFSTKEGLVGHERTHTGEKPYTCGVCDKSFATSSNFRTHMRHHTEGKRFLCNTCRMSFFTKSGLERHETLHTGVKSFECDVCAVAFYTKREVIRHKLFHLGNKRFSCDKCSKSYYERQHLIVHQRTHTGERPYSCNWCKKSFFERSKLKRHMHTHKL